MISSNYLTHISPKLVASELAGEIQIELSVTVHIRHGQSVPMVVMNPLVILAGVVNDMMLKPNVALLPYRSEN